MAIREGRCPNCGSILTLDDKMEKGHCLFCDAVFENSRAIEIAADPSGVEFPNEEQPKYEGPSLDPVLRNTPAAKIAAAPRTEKKAARRAPVQAEAYTHKDPIKLPEVKLTPKKRIQVALVFIIIAAIIAGIGIPTVTKRDNDRKAIVASFAEVLEYDIDAAQAIGIRKVANDYLLLALPEDVDQKEAASIFRSFCDVRAEVRGESAASYDKVYGGVTMRLLMPSGGFMISEPADDTELESGAAIKPLS